MHEDIDIANSADNNTPYTSAKYMDVVEFLEKASVSLFKWFEINLLKANVSKCRFLTSIDQKVSLNVDNFTITMNVKNILELSLIQNLYLISTFQIYLKGLAER